MIAFLLSCVFTVTPAIARTVLSVDPMLMRSVVRHESNFDRYAVSSTGAQGYAQLEPSTAKSVGVCNSYDAVENVAGGARYMASLLTRLHGNVRLAVAAYNAGPGAVEKYGTVPPYKETQDYVRRVLGTYATYTHRSEPKPTHIRTVPRLAASGYPDITRRASFIDKAIDPFQGKFW